MRADRRRPFFVVEPSCGALVAPALCRFNPSPSPSPSARASTPPPTTLPMMILFLVVSPEPWDGVEPAACHDGTQTPYDVVSAPAIALFIADGQFLQSAGPRVDFCMPHPPQTVAMGGCTSKDQSGGARDRNGDDADGHTFEEHDGIQELFALLRADFEPANAEVRVLAAMVKARRLDKISAELQALQVQRDATESNCPVDYLLQGISLVNEHNEVVIRFEKFKRLVANCFEPADIQNAVAQMRVLRNERQMRKYGTSSVRVESTPKSSSTEGSRAAAPRTAKTSEPTVSVRPRRDVGLSRLYQPTPDPSTAELA
jgi:hypothetical protein